MEPALIGIALGIVIGIACRPLDIPLTAPSKLVGALLVLAMTPGYVGDASVLPSIQTALSMVTTR
jgi:XapX domain-containing protein